MLKKVDKEGMLIESELSKEMQTKRNLAFEAMKKKALLVTLERTVFANFIYDVNFTTKICKDNKITDQSFIQVRKCLLHPRHVEKLMNITNDAIMLLWNLTKPWDNNDYRVLPMELYDDLTMHMQKLQEHHEEAVQEFVDNYDNYIDEAKQSLGSAFDKNNYPDKNNIKDVFILKVVTRELPEIDDIRLNLTEQELVDLQNEASSSFQSSINTAQNKLINMLDKIESLIEAKKVDAVLVKELSAFAFALGEMNIHNDPEITNRIDRFTSILDATFDDIDIDELMLSDAEKDKRKYEGMKEEEMLMTFDENDEIGDW